MKRFSFRLATALIAIGIGCSVAATSQAQNLTVAVGGNITSMRMLPRRAT